MLHLEHGRLKCQWHLALVVCGDRELWMANEKSRVRVKISREMIMRMGRQISQRNGQRIASVSKQVIESGDSSG